MPSFNYKTWMRLQGLSTVLKLLHFCRRTAELIDKVQYSTNSLAEQGVAWMESMITK